MLVSTVAAVYVTGNERIVKEDTPGAAVGRLVLPDAPAELTGSVKAWREPVWIDTYEPERPSSYPMFLEKRVYQGSSGRVYPLPFIDRIASEPKPRLWDAIHIENEYLRLLILPEIGGRIHVGYDKISGYDFFYRQNVIKPALVGLAGPWISGGVEFNWPQHHRPATYMPVETAITTGPDGEVTVWCSDHDPMLHMKGMHGVCLRPGRAVAELKVRLYNRTPLTQTFLWWANVATRVHEQYQSFFPTDVSYVADHAKRAVTSFPLSDRAYYGVDYAARAQRGVPDDERPSHFQPDGSYAANDLSWYANIPVPTSYMIVGSSQDFFGGYDHRAQAGVVHVADHHIAPGKKQWTWGNHDFGYAWDRCLTDSDGPYIELMAGVYTDNQPDFSYLAPWETKTFSQFWYPIRRTGVPQMANTEGALHVDVNAGVVNLAVMVTRDTPEAEVQLFLEDRLSRSWPVDLRVAETFTQSWELEPEVLPQSIAVKVVARDRTILEYAPATVQPANPPEVAREPKAPEQILTVEELYLTGVHLNQYRHATRQPELYWREALRRDPGETRCLNAMGLWHLRRGELAEAVACLRAAIQRWTSLNPNPYDGEAFYNLGIALRLLGNSSEAYEALYKATWNSAWRGPAYFALGEIDAARGEWAKAEDHLRRSLRAEADHLNARNLLVHVLGKLGRAEEAARMIEETLALDPLDAGMRWARGIAPQDGQMVLDVAFDLARAGRNDEALRLLEQANPATAGSAAPMILLALADLQAMTATGDVEATLQRLATIPDDLCFPSRVEEMLVLQRTVERYPDHALSWYLLGNLLYDRRRHVEAIRAWESAVRLDATRPTAWRNLGIAYFNIRQDVAAALHAFDRALENDPKAGRVLYERDQLWKRVGRSRELRLSELLSRRDLVEERDDLSLELATLYNQLGRPEDALALLLRRNFQPWEGGEGVALGQFVRAHLLIGRRALHADKAREGLEHFQAALQPPRNLGEARHLLANQGDIHFWLGRAYEALGQKEDATLWYEKAIRQKGDFQQMSVRSISNMTFWAAMAMLRLGHATEAHRMFCEILAHAEQLENTAPTIDYFATSLPSMLLFEDDLARHNRIEAAFLNAQASFGLGWMEASESLLCSILQHDVNHAGAQDLMALHAQTAACAGAN